MDGKIDKNVILEMLPYIDNNDYDTWLKVGMALKHEGFDWSVWDDWSQGSPKYCATGSGSCRVKWYGFKEQNAGAPVTGGTIYELAKQGGWKPKHPESSYENKAFDWDSTITKDSEDMVVIPEGYLETEEFREPSVWDPVKELSTYIETLFQSTEYVGYVTGAYENEKDGKRHFAPNGRGSFVQTAGELLESLRICDGDIASVLGGLNEKAGAWIRFNPLDGNGVMNKNVTEYRYALLESDSISLEKQEAIIRQMELPVAAMVFSGGKSVHAIARIDAQDMGEYQKRVSYLYKACEKNGFPVDRQNKNPSRLSRMPGVTRNGRKQFLMATNIGKKSWDEWYDWIEGINDDLPDPVNLADVWDNLPPLADCLIEGVLRKGHKMLIAGPSKAGKSIALIELCIAIAEGRSWMGFPCAKGKVFYVNLEVDDASCLHRFHDVYEAMGIRPDNFQNIDIWNLRGKAVPMDKLAPKLIRRCEKKSFDAVIIDPIYKVITGDENSADQMAAFCNQFDKICNDLHASVIYCHHHSKGLQGDKRAMDRASGSGVFARDPDAQLDVIQLEIGESLRDVLDGKAQIRTIAAELDRRLPGWRDDASQDGLESPAFMQDFVNQHLSKSDADAVIALSEVGIKKDRKKTAWRIEGTLREFESFDPVNVWFDYPVHYMDETDLLKHIQPESTTSKFEKFKKAAERRKEAKQDELDGNVKEFLKIAEKLFSDGRERVTVPELVKAGWKKKSKDSAIAADKWLKANVKTGKVPGYDYPEGGASMGYVVKIEGDSQSQNDDTESD